MLIDLAHFNAPVGERFAGLDNICHHQMQGLYGSRLHFRDLAQTGSDDDRTTRSRGCKLNNPQSITRLDIMVHIKPHLFSVESLSAINVSNWYWHKLKFHIHHYSSRSFM